LAKFERTFAYRIRSDRSGLRYPSDVTNEEWIVIERIIPPAKRGGNKRTIDIRRVVDGLMFVLSTGCQWTAIPKDMPPRTTLNEYFRRWEYDGTLIRIHHALCGTCHDTGLHATVPTSGMIASKSVRVADSWTSRPAQAGTMRDMNAAPRNEASW
jgi:transposase